MWRVNRAMVMESTPSTIDTSNMGEPLPAPPGLVHSGNQSVADPFLALSRVPSPAIRGYYDPGDWHRLTTSQVEALLSRRHDEGRFDRYAFGTREFNDFFTSVCSVLVKHFNTFRPANDDEARNRVLVFEFIQRRYRALDRRVHRQ